MKTRSFQTRLVAGTVVWLLATLLATGVALSVAFRRSVELGFDERLRSLLLAVIAALDVPPDNRAVMTRAVPEPLFERVYSGWYWQVTDGEHRLRSRSLWDEVLVDANEADSAAYGSDIRGPRQEQLRVVEETLHFPSRLHPIRVVVAAPLAEIQREIDAFDRLLFGFLIALGVGLALAVAIQVAYGLHPLRRLVGELEHVRTGRQGRLRRDYPREVTPLVDAINDVLDQDARLIERSRTHAGNLAHALKTPLSVLAAESHRAMDPACVTKQVQIMTRLIDHHLTRAAAAGSKRALGARTDVGMVVAELRTMLLRLHAERNLSIDARIPPDTVFAGEREDLEEILGNIMDNACKWGTTCALIRAETTEHWVRLRVEDDGPGLEPEAAQLAIGRGTRLDSMTPGSGLGLSIAADLTELYGGTLTLERADLGGLRVCLELPAP